MKKVFLRTENNYDADEVSLATALHCPEPTRTQQQFKDECDINILYSRYLETGEIPQVLDEGLAYGDFTGIFDFKTAMNAVRAAEETFTQLPARIKNRFDNDPQKLLEFMNKEENRDEAEFLGLVTKPQENQDETRTGSVPEGRQEAATANRGTAPSKGAGTADEKPGPKTGKDD